MSVLYNEKEKNTINKKYLSISSPIKQLFHKYVQQSLFIIDQRYILQWRKLHGHKIETSIEITMIILFTIVIHTFSSI